MYPLGLTAFGLRRGEYGWFRPLSVVGLRQKRYPVTLDCDGMGSIPAIPEARYVPLLLCHERINEASLPGWFSASEFFTSLQTERSPGPTPLALRQQPLDKLPNVLSPARLCESKARGFRDFQVLHWTPTPG